MIPFVIVNGALTGLFLNQQVVWYNQNEILNIYLFTIPIEDIINIKAPKIFQLYFHKVFLTY